MTLIFQRDEYLLKILLFIKHSQVNWKPSPTGTESDWQAYLQCKSEQPESLPRSILFAQALRFFRICSASNDFQDSCDKLRNKLIEKGCEEQKIDKGIGRTKAFDRQKLLGEKTKKRSNRISLVLTYNCILPNVINNINIPFKVIIPAGRGWGLLL